MKYDRIKISSISENVFRSIVAEKEWSKAEWDAYKKKHPKTKIEPTFSDEKGGEKGGKLSQLSNKAKEKLKSLPKNVGNALKDKESRAKLLGATAKKIKESPKKFGSAFKKHFKHELKEISAGTKKIMTGKKPNKAEAKAMLGFGVEVAAAGIALASGGTLAGAGFLGKSFVKHVALMAINPLLGDAYILAEGGHVVGEMDTLLNLIHLASEKELSSEDAENAFINFILAAIHKKLSNGISDEEMAEILNADDVEITDDMINSLISSSVK